MVTYKSEARGLKSKERDVTMEPEVRVTSFAGGRKEQGPRNAETLQPLEMAKIQSLIWSLQNEQSPANTLL